MLEGLQGYQIQQQMQADQAQQMIQPQPLMQFQIWESNGSLSPKGASSGRNQMASLSFNRDFSF